MSRLTQVETEIGSFRRHKRVLTLGDDLLVDAVAETLKEGFQLPIRQEEEYREDLLVLDSQGSPMVLAEIKGTNKGIKREYINQADSHRERAGLAADFPTVLIVNTHMTALRLADKDKPPATEQVRHAAKMRVLILRTIDLLQLLRLTLRNDLAREDVINLLRSGGGWLRVSAEGYEIVST